MGQRKKSEKNQFLMTKPQRHNEIRYEGKFNIFSSSQKITWEISISFRNVTLQKFKNLHLKIGHNQAPFLADIGNKQYA